MIVIDASVALKWVLPEDGSDSARALRNENLIAPSLWLIEAANALWRHASMGKLAEGDAALLLRELATAPVNSMQVNDDVSAALELAMRIDHPSYDCLYLALAVKHDTHVVTADRRFVAAVARDKALKSRIRLLEGV